MQAQNREVVVEFRSEANAQRVAADDKTTGFVGVAYSGGPVRGFFGDYAVDLSAMEIPAEGVSVLLNHDPGKIAGRAKLASDGKGLSVDVGTFTQATEHGREAAALMHEGHPWKLSIGASGEYRQSDPKKAIQLNGRSMHLDGYISKPRLLELSLVPAGADRNAYAAKLSARYGLQQPNGANMPGDTQNTDLDAARARVAELEAANAKLATDLGVANTALAAQAKAARLSAIEKCFGKDAEISKEHRAAYESMTAEQFAAVEVAMAAARVGSDSALFRQTATNGQNQEGPGVTGKVTAPQGYTVDQASAEIHQKAVKFAAENKVDYWTAIEAVAGA